MADTGARIIEEARAIGATLAGIAIGFISMTYALRIWSWPLIALVPMAIVLVTYFSDFRFPLGLPGGLVAIVAGTLLAWLLPAAWSGHAMETAAVARIAEENEIPFIAFRAISDLAGGGQGQNEFWTFLQLAADNSALTAEAFMEEWRSAPVLTGEAP